jgi:hypothetical protein
VCTVFVTTTFPQISPFLQCIQQAGICHDPSSEWLSDFKDCHFPEDTHQADYTKLLEAWLNSSVFGVSNPQTHSNSQFAGGLDELKERNVENFTFQSSTCNVAGTTPFLMKETLTPESKQAASQEFESKMESSWLPSNCNWSSMGAQLGTSAELQRPGTAARRSLDWCEILLLWP